VAVAIVAALVVIGVGAYVGLSWQKNGPDYAVDKCVQRQGDSATIVDCSVQGAYKIVSVVDNQTKCADARQPWLEVTEANGSKSYRCLVPASPANDGGTAPSATASATTAG
jgi:hypothetical protein